MTLLLVPMQAALFLGLTLTSLPANLWAVPIVSLVTVPLILLAVMFGFFPSLSYGLWWLADFTLQWVFVPLNYLQRGWVDLGRLRCWPARRDGSSSSVGAFIGGGVMRRDWRR